MSSPGSRHVHGSSSTVNSVSTAGRLGVSNQHAPPYVASNAAGQIPAWRTASQPSSASTTTTTTGNLGPSRKEPEWIISVWKIGWFTPTMMLGSYFLALAVAIGHFLFFTNIDGKEADGPHQVIAQSFVTTISNVLANVFGYCLKGGLSLAFVQYLWYLLRIESMKVSTIELLFSIRSNPFVLLRPAALRATPVLFALAILVWATQIIVSFPPGAITVESRQKLSFDVVKVPTFNASFMGNASGLEANAYSLNTLNINPPNGFTTTGLDGNKNANLIPRLASQVLISGETLPMASPCGVNCSYIVQFDGPYFNCNSSSTNIYYNNSSPDIFIYNGSWFDPRSRFGRPSRDNGTFTVARFNTSTFTPLAADADAFFSRIVNNGSILMQQDTLACVPGRATYTVNNIYTNNIQTRIITTEPISPLIDLAPLSHGSEVIVPGFVTATSPPRYGTQVANWTDYSRTYYRDNNIMTIFDALMGKIQGGYVADLVTPESLNFSAPTNTTTWFGDLEWIAYVGTSDTGALFSTAAQNGTIIDITRFNTAFGRFSAFESAHPVFNITEDVLNEYLFNMTTSIMAAYGAWQTTANATISTTINVYSFSRPLALLLPYFISLGLAAPFMLLGAYTLLKNGVSAMDGSFTQIITTSTGSAVLDKAAAGGCLGGNESIPKELKDLRIRFGEFVGREDPRRIRRAGFGVESEIVPLRKGASYGIARWI